MLQTLFTFFGRFVVILFTLIPRVGSADDTVRPQGETDLTPGTFERDRVVFVPGSIPVGFNREQFLRDFPELAEVLPDERAFESFLSQTLSFVGTEQPRLNGVRNTPIPIDPNRTKTVISRNRSAGWLELGDVRAAFVEVKHPRTKQVLGLVGSKGIGFKTSLGSDSVAQQRAEGKKIRETFEAAAKAVRREPGLSEAQRSAKLAALRQAFDEQKDSLRTRDHSSGLTTFGEAFHEMAKQRALQLAFDIHNAKHGTNFQTNEVYGIVALPFYVYSDNNKKDRAALIVRQSEFRGPQFSGFRQGIPESLFKDWYGFSQGTVSNALIDFGGALSEDPRLARVFEIQDPELKAAHNAQGSRAWAVGHEIPAWLKSQVDQGALSQQEADRLLKENTEKTLAWMLEPVQHERSSLLAQQPPRTRTGSFERLWQDLRAARRGTGRPLHNLADSLVDFLRTSSERFAIEQSEIRRQRLQTPEPDSVATRRGEFNVLVNDARLRRQQQRLLTQQVEKHLSSLETAVHLSKREDPIAKMLAVSFLPPSDRATPIGQAVLLEALAASVNQPPEQRTRFAAKVIAHLERPSFASAKMVEALSALFKGTTIADGRRVLVALGSKVSWIPHRGFKKVLSALDPENDSKTDRFVLRFISETMIENRDHSLFKSLLLPLVEPVVSSVHSVVSGKAKNPLDSYRPTNGASDTNTLAGISCDQAFGRVL